MQNLKIIKNGGRRQDQFNIFKFKLKNMNYIQPNKTILKKLKLIVFRNLEFAGFENLL